MRISDWSSDVCSSDLDALLAAAASIFFEQGYEATRIDDIIERAGGSKRNIYEEFGSKEGLFAAIVTERAERALSALAMDEIRARSLEETLRLLGRQLMDSHLSKELLGVFWIAILKHVRSDTRRDGKECGCKFGSGGSQ